MKYIFSFALAIACLMGPAVSKAQEGRVLLATITSDYDDHVNQLWLLQDQYGQATGLQKIELNSRVVKTFSVRDLPAGITVKEKDGHRVFILRSNQFDPGRGGPMQLDYLKNGINGSREAEEIEAQVGHQGWQLLHEGTVFHRIQVESRRFLGRVVGVKEVHFLP